MMLTTVVVMMALAQAPVDAGLVPAALVAQTAHALGYPVHCPRRSFGSPRLSRE